MLALRYYHNMMLRGDQFLLRGHNYSTETTSCWHTPWPLCNSRILMGRSKVGIGVLFYLNWFSSPMSDIQLDSLLATILLHSFQIWGTGLSRHNVIRSEKFLFAYIWLVLLESWSYAYSNFMQVSDRVNLTSFLWQEGYTAVLVLLYSIQMYLRSLHFHCVMLQRDVVILI